MTESQLIEKLHPKIARILAAYGQNRNWPDQQEVLRLGVCRDDLDAAARIAAIAGLSGDPEMQDLGREVSRIIEAYRHDAKQ